MVLLPALYSDLKELPDLIPILAFLLPGFVSSGIVSLLVIRKPQEVFVRVLEALIFTTLNLAVFFSAQSYLSTHKIPVLTVDSGHFFTAGNLTLLAFCAVGIGLIWSFEANNQWLFWVLRFLRITSKSTKPTLWVDVFSTERNRYAVVHLKDGRRVVGWVRRYSDDAADRALFLEQASWLTDDGAFVNNPRINVMVDRETEISLVEFVKPREKPRRQKTVKDDAKSVEVSQGASKPKPTAQTWPWVYLFSVTVLSYILFRRQKNRIHDHE